MSFVSILNKIDRVITALHCTCILIKVWNVLTRIGPNFNSNLIKLPLKLGHDWAHVATSRSKLNMCIYFLIHVLISYFNSFCQPYRMGLWQHPNLKMDMNCAYIGTGARSRYLRQGNVIASHNFLWDAIPCTYPCLRYLLLAPKSSYELPDFAIIGSDMACHLFGPKLFSEPVLDYCQ